MRVNGMPLFFITLFVLVVAWFVGWLSFSFHLPEMPGAAHNFKLLITSEQLKVIIAAIISIIVLIPTLKLVARGDSSDERVKWCCGTIGTIIGYWIG